MHPKEASARYGSLLISLHWLMLLLIVAVYACIELRELYPTGSEIREGLKTWHFMLGIAVFALVWVRLLARFVRAVPPIVPQPPRWQLFLAHLTELAIYLFMIVMPLLGWLILSAENRPVPFFGIELPALIGPNKALAKQLEEIHETVGNVGYFLIGIHAAAALAHHYLHRDNTLVRMLPSRSRSGT
ncbi:MAG TPA: cytochrome b [Steroidobacteraceae bacterium]|jgi:cytochrome b561|nr:cytochrome b [Steroidobacteraceae bacterium]